MTRWQAASVWLLGAAAVGLSVVGWVILFLLRTPQPGDVGWGVPGSFGLWAVAFAVSGYLIVRSAPSNRIGWLLLAAGAAAGLNNAATELWLYLTSIDSDAADLAIRGLWGWLAAIGLMVMAIMLFPDGSLPSRRWRPVLWILAITTAFFVVVVILTGGGSDESTVGDPLFVFFQFATIAGILALPVRFRRSHGIERQQMKWLAWTAGLIAVTALIVEVGLGVLWQSPLHTPGTWVLSLLPILIPVSIGIAVLRYRLYDLDLVINRTLVYSIVVVVLAVLYVAAVVFLRELVQVGDSALAVAASTLAVAALFNPLRKRVQRLVDRRFYRSRYDAQRVAQDFAARLRDEIDLEELTSDWLGVVQETVQPSSVSVWVREQP